MYQAKKFVSDREDTRAPQGYIERSARKDLYHRLISDFEQSNRNIEDYLLRFTSNRRPLGGEWGTEYELTAVLVSDATALLGRGIY